VFISGFAFEPTDLRVNVGTTVTWTNNDPTPHTVTGEGFDTGPLDQNASGTVTFESASTFDYFCAIHPNMQGRVVVAP
jgi:plastocyanin